MAELDHLAACIICDHRMDEGTRKVICCVNGHGICSICREKRTVCPTCNDPFSQESHTLLRKLLEALPKSCPNTGCSKVIPQSGILEHVTWCDYRFMQCWSCDDSCETHNIESHYETKHPEHLVQDDSMFFEIPDKEDYKSTVLFKVASGQMFQMKIALVESAEKMYTIGFEWVLREVMQGHQDMTYKVSAAILEKEGEELKTSVKSMATLHLEDNLFGKVCLPVATDKTGDVILKITFKKKEKNVRKKKIIDESQGSRKKIKL